MIRKAALAALHALASGAALWSALTFATPAVAVPNESAPAGQTPYTQNCGSSVGSGASRACHALNLVDDFQAVGNGYFGSGWPIHTTVPGACPTIELIIRGASIINPRRAIVPVYSSKIGTLCLRAHISKVEIARRGIPTCSRGREDQG